MQKQKILTTQETITPCCGSDSSSPCCGSVNEAAPVIQKQSVDSGCCSSTSTPSCCGGNEPETSPTGSCCTTSQQELPEWICGYLETPAGKVPQITTTWTKNDRWGQIKARTTVLRMSYTVVPRLYAVGAPNENSDVFVSANYKLSFDVLRRELTSMSAWILVLDTKGINVWCAAGKGTFGTGELIYRIQETQLAKVVSHKRIIVPQLGAPGVSAAQVKKQTGFRVMFGPVQAQDIPAYVSANYTATREMRTITFPLKDRLVLTPMEIVPVLKHFPLYALIVLLFFGLQPSGIVFKNAWTGGWSFLVFGALAMLAGAFLTPALLPFVPFRSFAIKGWIIGLIVILLGHLAGVIQMNSSVLGVVIYLLFPLIASYIALQFTGSTPYTGISGVQKELRYGLPVYLAGTGLSVVLLIIYKVSQWV